MAHFAQLDECGVVLRVSVVCDEDAQDEAGNEDEQIGLAYLKSIHGDRTIWVQTSRSGRIRGRFAAPGMIYDALADEFIDPPPLEVEPSQDPTNANNQSS